MEEALGSLRQRYFPKRWVRFAVRLAPLGWFRSQHGKRSVGFVPQPVNLRRHPDPSRFLNDVWERNGFVPLR